MEACFGGFSTQWKQVSATFPHNGSLFSTPWKTTGGASRPRRAAGPQLFRRPSIAIDGHRPSAAGSRTSGRESHPFGGAASCRASPRKKGGRNPWGLSPFSPARSSFRRANSKGTVKFHATLRKNNPRQNEQPHGHRALHFLHSVGAVPFSAHSFSRHSMRRRTRCRKKNPAASPKSAPPRCAP